jgi:hypothetical protein
MAASTRRWRPEKRWAVSLVVGGPRSPLGWLGLDMSRGWSLSCWWLWWWWWWWCCRSRVTSVNLVVKGGIIIGIEFPSGIKRIIVSLGLIFVRLYSFPFLKIGRKQPTKQCCGSGFNGVPGSISGSRRAKMVQKIEKS